MENFFFCAMQSTRPLLKDLYVECAVVVHDSLYVGKCAGENLTCSCSSFNLSKMFSVSIFTKNKKKRETERKIERKKRSSNRK